MFNDMENLTMKNAQEVLPPALRLDRPISVIVPRAMRETDAGTYTGFSPSYLRNQRAADMRALRRGEIRTLADWRIRPVRSYTHADQEVYAQLSARERMAANLLLTAA